MSCTFFIILLILLIEKAILIEIIDEDSQKEFAKKYNDVRSRYARGEISNFSSVTNMMEALWSTEAANFSENILKQLCDKGSYSVSVNQYHFLTLSSDRKKDGLEYWADAFYRDPEGKNTVAIQHTIRPEVTEIGCAVSFCRKTSYAVCSHGKTSCSGDCIKYDTGPVCLKCPTGTKCTFDGLCSFRKNVVNIPRRMSIKYQPVVVRLLNAARTKIAFGKQKFDYDETGAKKKVKFPSATKMMEVKWSDSAAEVAESAMADYCVNGSASYDKGKYQLVAEYYYPRFYDEYDAGMIADVFFDPMDTSWPLYLSSDLLKLEQYSNFFSWMRKMTFISWDSVTEIGCSFEYCRENAIFICAYGEVTCFSNCTVYETGKTCSKCPAGTTCTFDGLCSSRNEISAAERYGLTFALMTGMLGLLEASTKFTKITGLKQSKIIDKINEVRSMIANGEHEYFANEKGEEAKGYFPTATNMMEVRWSNNCVNLAESKIIQYCKDPYSLSTDDDYKTAAWSRQVSFENSINRSGEYWNTKLDDFTPAANLWPLTMTAEDQNSEMFQDIFHWERFNLLVSWASVSYMGCAIEYCRGEVIKMCAMGPFGTCSPNCSVYETGTVCSNCPENTECGDVFLCRGNDTEQAWQKGSKSWFSLFNLVVVVVRFFKF